MTFNSHKSLQLFKHLLYYIIYMSHRNTNMDGKLEAIHHKYIMQHIEQIK